MGMSNEAVLTGHLGMNIHWGGGGHHHRHLNTIPMPSRSGNWLDHYFERGGQHSVNGFWDHLLPGRIIAKDKAKKQAAQDASEDGPATADPASDPAIQAATNVYNAIVTAWYPKSVRPFVMDQAAMETDGFTSTAFIADNNASGISPDGTHPRGSSKWRHFPSINAWATAMKVVISKNKGAGRPIDATTLKDYVHRLKVNGYFGKESEASYYEKVRATGVRWRNIMSLETDTRQKIDIPKDRGGLLDMARSHPLVTGIVLTVTGILVIKAINRR